MHRLKELTTLALYTAAVLILMQVSNDAIISRTGDTGHKGSCGEDKRLSWGELNRHIGFLMLTEHPRNDIAAATQSRPRVFTCRLTDRASHGRVSFPSEPSFPKLQLFYLFTTNFFHLIQNILPSM